MAEVETHHELGNSCGYAGSKLAANSISWQGAESSQLAAVRMRPNPVTWQTPPRSTVRSVDLVVGSTICPSLDYSVGPLIRISVCPFVRRLVGPLVSMYMCGCVYVHVGVSCCELCKRGRFNL